MLRLRKILLYNSIYYLIFFIILTILFIRINQKNNIELDSNIEEGILIDYHYDNLKMDFIIKNKYKYKCILLLEDESEFEKYKNYFVLGNKLKISGKISKISRQTNPNIFDYSKYMKSKNIYRSIYVKRIELITNNKNVLYKIKEFIYKRINNYKSKKYLYTFILGDNRYLDKSIRDNYQKLGISHLFSVSGMHITILTGTLIKILKIINIKEKSRYIISSIFIFLFLFLVSFTPSALRSGLFFILLLINKYYYLNIKVSNILLLTISIILLFNPFIIYNAGFIFSASITYSLIIFSDVINKKDNYIYKLLMTSFIAFLVSIPISLYNYYEINILTVFYNLIFVPLVSLIIFPLSCISLFIKVLDYPLYILLSLLENISTLLSSIKTNITFIKPSILFIILYYVLLYLYFLKNKKCLLLLGTILIFSYNYNFFIKSEKVIFLDVGQGDSTFIQLGNDNVLIDTGGNNKDIVSNITIPLLKSLGIRKIDYLIITHGDFDHMGEAINLVNNFKVEKVIFNCGSYNDLEKELINVLDKKKIKYYSCIKELNIDNNKLYFLQTKKYDNENDNSNVIYTELGGYKFIFMGDAGIEKEKDILDKYNINDIDVLKVGHHGSKTSSSKDFINYINPKYSIISVGKNNRYGHPNKEVLSILENSKIYRTDEDGSIMFKIKNNKLKIETCTP